MSQRIDEQEEPFELLGPLDESAGPAPRISQQRSAELVQGVLAAMETSSVPSPKHLPPAVLTASTTPYWSVTKK